jgi:hypothetical protein
MHACRELYADADELPPGADEPEERRRLRERRLAEKHAKMKAALMEKQSKEEEEATRRSQQQNFKATHRERIDVWKNKNKVGLEAGRCVTGLLRGRAVAVGPTLKCSLACLKVVRLAQCKFQDPLAHIRSGCRLDRAVKLPAPSLRPPVNHCLTLLAPLTC